ncbi:PPC domain-containing DNA-binding protein [uncultured Ramlibacter sp.]|uniref:PPC domain-containing DNA-binding protein n=1 Tax=uncultured Ramlibacter sp. TaxID=260755 RepID=UPI002638D762|nr:PPC domain-containing DNA-binding protein [uncultured Ramlibacter sp.]
MSHTANDFDNTGLSPAIDTLVLRLNPGEDLRATLAAAFADAARTQGMEAACVVSGIGSLTQAVLRYAQQEQGTRVDGPLELLTLAGTLSADGAHLHASVSDARGAVLGGHLMPGCTVRTTAEVVLALLPQWHFARRPDAATGYLELVATRKAGKP